MTSHHHACEALVLTCIDFRFHEQLLNLLRDRGLESFDLKTDAGGVKFLISSEKPEVSQWILKNIEIAKSLHGIHKIVLVNHFDCGAYGGSKTLGDLSMQLSFHTEELRKAADLLSHKFPELEVEKYFAEMKGREVELVEI